MGITVFKTEPSAVAVRAFLGRTIAARAAKPKHLICDGGSQLWPCKDFKARCDRKNIKPRFGAVGEHGGIALVERFLLTRKQVLARLPLIPLRRESFRNELAMIIPWYNEPRPHDSLGGETPNEVYEDRFLPVASQGLSHAPVGHAVHRVPSLKRWLPESRDNGLR